MNVSILKHHIYFFFFKKKPNFSKRGDFGRLFQFSFIS